MKRTIGQTLLVVEQNLSSIFTKEDVVELLRNIEEEAELSDYKKDEIINEIMQSIESEESNLVDRDSIRLTIDSSNYISIDSFDVEFGLIRNVVKDIIENL
jgi:CRISPR/Cas system CSM-associated protein Csm4 (group 5 of RAMP superfamily)